jgi:hypothetical protein
MSVLDQRPDFDDAVRQFRAFLQGQGWPTKIVWARAGDISRQSSGSVAVHRHDGDAAVEARGTYEKGCQVGLGVALEAVGTLGDAAVATVSYPSDERDAELLMYPSNGGLKMSAAIPRVEVTVRWSSC